VLLSSLVYLVQMSCVLVLSLLFLFFNSVEQISHLLIFVIAFSGQQLITVCPPIRMKIFFNDYSQKDEMEDYTIVYRCLDSYIHFKFSLMCAVRCFNVYCLHILRILNIVL